MRERIKIFIKQTFWRFSDDKVQYNYKLQNVPNWIRCAPRNVVIWKRHTVFAPWAKQYLKPSPNMCTKRTQWIDFFLSLRTRPWFSDINKSSGNFRSFCRKRMYGVLGQTRKQTRKHMEMKNTRKPGPKMPALTKERTRLEMKTKFVFLKCTF